MRARIKAGIWPFAGQIFPVVRQGTYRDGIGKSWVDVARPENPEFTFRYGLDEVELLPDEKGPSN